MISRWLGRENKQNVAQTRNCCGWPSSTLYADQKTIEKDDNIKFLFTCI